MHRKVLVLIIAAVLVLLGLLIWHWAGADFRGIHLAGEKEKPPEEEKVEIVSTIDDPIRVREALTRSENTTPEPEGEGKAEAPSITVSGKVIDEDTGLPIKAFTVILAEHHEPPEDLKPKQKGSFTFGAMGVGASKGSRGAEAEETVFQEVNDDEGLFSLQVTKGGKYMIWAQAPGYSDPRHEIVEVPPDEGLVGHVIRLKRIPVIRGRVVDDLSGIPVEGASIKWGWARMRRRTDEGKISRTVIGMGPPATTDEQGCFTITPPRDGLYVLTTTHPDYAARSDDAKADDEDVEIRLRQGFRIYGMALDDHGRPAQGVQIHFKGDEAVQGGPYLSGPTGEYRTDPIQPCNVRIWANAPGVTNDASFQFTEEAYRIEVRDRDVEVNFGPSPDHVTWKGTFFGWDGNPVAKGRIRVWNDRIDDVAKEKMVESGESIHRTIICDNEGRFEIRKLIPGTFRVDMCPQGETMMLHHAELEQITFDRPGIHELDLSYRRTEISGILLDGGTGKPVEVSFGFVSAYSQGRFYSKDLDKAARFRFLGLPPGSYSVSTHAEGYAPLNYGMVKLEADQIIDDLEILLPVNGELFVQVTGIEDIGKTVIDLEVQRSDGTPAWTVGPGQYLKEGMWAIRFEHEVGSWILVLKDATLGRFEKPYAIREGETTEIKVEVSEFRKK